MSAAIARAQAEDYLRENQGFGRLVLRKVANTLRLLAIVAIAVWIGYTQHDGFAAAVDRFFLRSGEMLQRLLS